MEVRYLWKIKCKKTKLCVWVSAFKFSEGEFTLYAVTVVLLYGKASLTTETLRKPLFPRCPIHTATQPMVDMLHFIAAHNAESHHNVQQCSAPHCCTKKKETCNAVNCSSSSVMLCKICLKFILRFYNSYFHCSFHTEIVDYFSTHYVYV